MHIAHNLLPASRTKVRRSATGEPGASKWRTPGSEGGRRKSAGPQRSVTRRRPTLLLPSPSLLNASKQYLRHPGQPFSCQFQPLQGNWVTQNQGGSI